MTMVVRDHVGQELLGRDPVGERVHLPRFGHRAFLGSEDGESRGNAGAVEQECRLATEVLLYLGGGGGDGLLAGDVCLDVEDLGRAGRGGRVCRGRHVENRNGSLVLVREPLHHGLANTRRTTRDDDELLVPLRALLSPLAMVGRVAREGAVNVAHKGKAGQ